MRTRNWSFLLVLAVVLLVSCPNSDETSSKTFIVTFDADNGSTPTTQTVNEGDKATKPTDPVKDGYSFIHWFNVATDAEWDFSTAITADLTLKTKWFAVPSINWGNEPNGTLTVINNVSKDMVIFQGQTPSINNILGGVEGLKSKTFDISDDVDDFGVGGFMILCGIAKNEYEANKTNLSKAKIEYSAMATYGQGKKFRVEISPNYTGDYAYRVTNIGRIGMELRKDSPDGEKIGYVPSLASNMLLYVDKTDGFAIYAVYVYYSSRSSGQVTTLRATSQFESVSVSPRLATSNEIQSYTLPADQGATWNSIKATLSSPVAYVTVTNSVANQSGRVTLSGTNWITSQNGYDSIGSGETLTYEIQSTTAGTVQTVVLTYFNQALQIPVLKDGATPVLKNGYDYTITVSGSGQTADGYTVTFAESATPRDLSSEIDTL